MPHHCPRQREEIKRLTKKSSVKRKNFTVELAIFVMWRPLLYHYKPAHAQQAPLWGGALNHLNILAMSTFFSKLQTAALNPQEQIVYYPDLTSTILNFHHFRL